MDNPNSRILKIIENSPSESIQLLLNVVDTKTVYHLIKAYGGDNIFIPKIDKLLKIERNEDIKEDYFQKGLSYKQLSQKYGLTERYIRTILFGGKKWNRI